LILPDYAAIAALPGFSENYKVLEYDIREPFGNPACKLRGPILLPTDGDKFYEICDCIFYACTDPNNKTKNFGTGCLAPRKLGTLDAQSPLALSADYPYAEFNYVPAVQMFAPGVEPFIVGNSFLTLHRDIPDGYQNQMFHIIKEQLWMSLRPKTLAIAGRETSWPGKRAATSIAMIDTGGGPVFLSDPEKYLWADDWPTPTTLPPWIGGSVCCQAISDDLAITLSDEKNCEFTFRVEPRKLPPLAQGLTLVMCKTCSYMEEHNGVPQDGMNIGGLSALFNYILIDYALARVGFKPKPPALV
jgi:hypothetical protein